MLLLMEARMWKSQEPAARKESYRRQGSYLDDHFESHGYADVHDYELFEEDDYDELYPAQGSSHQQVGTAPAL